MSRDIAEMYLNNATENARCIQSKRWTNEVLTCMTAWFFWGGPGSVYTICMHIFRWIYAVEVY